MAKNKENEDLLDSTDRKILYALYKDARKPVSVLARELGLTREIVQYRMEKLEREQIVTAYLARIDQSYFAAGVAELRCKLLRTNEQRFNAIVKAVQEHPAVNWSAELCGIADIVLTILYSNTNNLTETVTELIQVMGDTLQEHELALYSTEYKFDRRGLVGVREEEYNPKDFIHFSDKKEMKLDKTDLQIIAVLAQHCREKIVDIAKKTALSEDAVRARIKRLESSGLIRGYVPLLNDEKCGFESYYARFQVEHLTNDVVAKLTYYAHNNPYIVYCCRTAGRYNILMSISARNRKHFTEVLLDIRKHFGTLLTDYEFQLMVREFKGMYVPEKFIEARIRK